MIPNLSYHPNYISSATAQSLTQAIDTQIWMSPFKRRVQHYGYQYDYRKRSVTEEMYLGHLPDWLQFLALKLCEDGLMAEIPDQAIINEYHAGQGIAPHIDCEPCFGDTIASISIGSTCIMDFEHTQSKQTYHQILEPCSLAVMQKEARYDWTHSIKARQSDIISGKRIKRKRRLLLTFRRVILNYSK